MPAYWDLSAYRVDHARLEAPIGSADTALAKAIARAATSRDILDDDRTDPPGLEAALMEITSGSKALRKEHATAYRISLEAILKHMAPCITFSVDAKNTRMPAFGSYADRYRIPEALRVVHLNVFARLFDAPPQPRFPWSTGKRGSVDWPWATFVDRATLEKAATEITRLACEDDNLPAAAVRVLWQHANAKKRTMVVELASSSPKKGARNERERAKAQYALISKNQELVVASTLDDVLASVRSEDFEEAAMSAAPNAERRLQCPALRESDRARIRERITKPLKLSAYDAEIVDVVLALIGIVSAYDDKPKSVKSRKLLASMTERDGLMLYADGEQG